MWRWRDWVIEAYNRNLPFDRFTIEQLAGDLLPDADARPAHRDRVQPQPPRQLRGRDRAGGVRGRVRGGPRGHHRDRVARPHDRLRRCHDHKFDPVSQKEFYQLFAYFNNVPEKGRAVKNGNSPPYLKAPTREQAKQLAELDTKLKGAEAKWAGLKDEIAKAEAAWAKDADPKKVPLWFPARGLLKKWAFDAPLVYDGERFTTAADVGDFGYDDRFSFSLGLYPLKRSGRTRLAHAGRTAGRRVHRRTGGREGAGVAHQALARRCAAAGNREGDRGQAIPQPHGDLRRLPPRRGREGVPERGRGEERRCCSTN